MNTLEKLRLNVGNRQPVIAEDVIKLFALSLEATEKIKKDLETTLKSSTGDIAKELEVIIGDFDNLKVEITSLGEKLSNIESVINEKTQTAIGSVLSKITKIQGSIPNIPTASNLAPLKKKIGKIERVLSKLPDVDFSQVEARISEVESKIPTVESTTPEQLRDKLESLKDEDRLDSSAVKNLPQGIIVSSTPPEDPVLNQLWVRIP